MRTRGGKGPNTRWTVSPVEIALGVAGGNFRGFQLSVGVIGFAPKSSRSPPLAPGGKQSRGLTCPLSTLDGWGTAESEAQCGPVGRAPRKMPTSLLFAVVKLNMGDGWDCPGGFPKFGSLWSSLKGASPQRDGRESRLVRQKGVTRSRAKPGAEKS